MKNDLATSIVIAIIGFLISYFVCNMFMGDIDSVSFKVLNTNITAEVGDPNPEVFNANALNPTVETIINAGGCNQRDYSGNCIDEENQ